MFAFAELPKFTVILPKSTVEPLMSTIFDLFVLFNCDPVIFKPKGEGDAMLLSSPLGLFKVFPRVSLFFFVAFFSYVTKKGRGFAQPGVVIPFTGIIFSGSIFERLPDF
jgi:hypothetical protein